jgi:hypothetical protein
MEEKQEPGQYCREECQNQECGWCKSNTTHFDHDKFCGNAKFVVSEKQETPKVQFIEL